MEEVNVKCSEEFFKKFQQVVIKLKAPKNQRNNFGNFSYRSCEDIQEAVKKTISELKLDNVISYCTDKLVLVGARYYIEATAVFTDGVNRIEAKGYARESEGKKGMDDAQVTGATSSYARKYALNGLYSIDDTKLEAVPDIDAQKPVDKSKERKSFLDEINKCNTKEELINYFNTHKELQSNSEFMTAMSARKAKLNL